MNRFQIRWPQSRHKFESNVGRRYGLLSPFWVFRHRYSPVYIMIFYILFTLYVGVTSPLILAVSLSLASVMLINYLALRHICARVEFRRAEFKKNIKRGEPVVMKIFVNNNSLFDIHSLSLIEVALGDLEIPQRVDLEHRIPAGESGEVEYVLDQLTEYGAYHLRDVKVLLTDPIGFLAGEIHFKEEVTLKIVPPYLIQKSPMADAVNYQWLRGGKEIESLGDSSNFNRIREYSHGDPFRHIAWRLSAARNKLLVKQFDKNTLENVLILSEMNPYMHVISPDRSTWQVNRETCLKLVESTFEEGQSIRFINNFTHLEVSKNRNQLLRLKEHILSCSALRSVQENPEVLSIRDSLHKYRLRFGMGVKLYFITPFNYLMAPELLDFLKELRIFKISGTLFLINTHNFLHYSYFKQRQGNEVLGDSHHFHSFVTEVKQLGLEVEILETESASESVEKGKVA